MSPTRKGCPVAGERYLVVTADDFGIGPAVTDGILDLASGGLVTASVLLVNSPYAEDALKKWRARGSRMELGWHPCLTLDRPVAPASSVPSLVGDNGCFWPLGLFIRKLILGHIRDNEIAVELRAQYALCREMLGQSPAVVNFHHHLQVFHSIGAILRDVLARDKKLPYLRRIREPLLVTLRIRGARLKRMFLSSMGKREAERQAREGFPGNEWLIGITDPPYVDEPNFFLRWLQQVPGRMVELGCHPGYRDLSLIGRDCTAHDGHVQRRFSELNLLQHHTFKDACLRAGFELISPSQATRILGYARAA